MNYTIISTETPAFDGIRKVLNIDANGNKYTVCYMVWDIDEPESRITSRRTVDTIDEAYRIYEKIARMMATGCYNDEDRRQILQTA